MVAAAPDFSPGSLFASRYEIVRLLGRGGMGMVYLARDRTLDEVVAIKILRPEFADDAGMAARFKSEIKLARKVRHRNVGAIHDFGQDGRLLYISMEYIEGVDLKQLLKEQGAFRPDEAYELAIQVAEGLQAVHEAGVIHRDLKAPNIMRDAKGHARLMDFGIAKQHGTEGATATGNIIGTPEYMSPEQAQGHKVDFRSDVYALGVVVYELFTGNVPFRGETPIATILKHIQDPPALEGPGAPALPPEMVPLLRKCLAKEPGRRFSTARDVAEALREARSAGLEVTAPRPLVRPMGAPAPAPRRPDAPRAMWPLALVATLIAVAVAAGLWIRRSPEPEPAAVPGTASPVPVAAATATAEPTVAPSVASPTPLPPTPSPGPTPAPQRTTPPMPPALRTSAPVAAAVTSAPTTAPSTVPSPSRPPDEAGTGLLQIVVVPWADVFIDGQQVGTTPMDKVSLKAGTHHVRLRYPTYENVERTIVIRPGQTEKLRFDFPKEGVRKP